MEGKVVLSWLIRYYAPGHATIKSYDIYAYQESNAVLPSGDLWLKLGIVEALTLPMACTMTELTKGVKYHFAIRGRDEHNRVGLFSNSVKVLV